MDQFIEFDPSKQPRCKVELHAHLDGAVRLTTVWEIAQKKKLDLNKRTLEDLIDGCRIDAPSTLANFLKPFSIFQPVIAGDAEAVERLAFEFCEDAAKQGVLYSEVRYCPHLLSSTHGMCANAPAEPLTPRGVVMAVNRGLCRGTEEFEIMVRSILCCFRPSPKWSNEILDLCLEFRDEGVVGIDVAGDEATGLADPEIISVFKRAAVEGIGRTVHAGEAGPAVNVQRAISEMKAQRIGHGYHVVDDPNIYSDCLADGIHFETCPYSSVLTGSVSLAAIKHPIVRFAEDNANFSISRDDPTIIQKTLDQEYDFLRGFGLKDVHFVRANFNAARSSFLPPDHKKVLLEELVEIYGVHDTFPTDDNEVGDI